MEQETNNRMNPVMTFFHQNILKKYTYHIYRQLEMIYDGNGGDLFELTHEGQPICDWKEPDNHDHRNVTLTNEMVAGLFLYHYTSFYLQKEMTEEEMEPFVPLFQSFLSGEETVRSYTMEQVGYLLWLYEHKRVPVEWAVRLLYEAARKNNEVEYDVFLKIPDIQGLITSYGESYRAFIEDYKQDALNSWAEKEEKWRKIEEEKQEELHEIERILDLFAHYEKDRKGLKNKLALLENDSIEESNVVRFRKLRGMLDEDGILWIGGKGKMLDQFIFRLPAQLQDKCKGIYFAEGITDINEGDFAGYDNLIAVHLADSIKNIKKQAFAECEKLSYVKMSSHLRYIGAKAFQKCKNLKKIVLPKTMEYLHKDAFAETGTDVLVTNPEECKVIRPVRVFTDDEGGFYYLED